jgi:hypothetical protein
MMSTARMKVAGFPVISEVRFAKRVKGELMAGMWNASVPKGGGEGACSLLRN